MLSWVPHLLEEVAPLLRAQVEDAQTPPREPVCRDDPVGGVLLLVLDNFFKHHQMWGSKEKLSLESQHWRLERGYSLLQSLINRVPNPHGHILGALRDLCASPEESTVDTLSMDVHVQNIQQASHRAMGLVECQYSELAVQVEASLTRDIKVLEDTKLAEATAHLETLEKVDIQRKRDALNHARISKRKVAQKEDLQKYEQITITKVRERSREFGDFQEDYRQYEDCLADFGELCRENAYLKYAQNFGDLHELALQVQTLKEGVAHFQAMLDELASRQPLGLVLEGRQLEEEISLKLATFNHLQAQLNDELKVSQQLQHKLDQWDDSALLARVADLEMKWTRKQDSLRKSRPSLELTSIRHLKDELEAEIRELETLELEVPDK